MQLGTPSSVAHFWRTKPFAIAAAVFAILSLLLVGSQYQANTHAQSTQLNWTMASTKTGTMAGGNHFSTNSLPSTAHLSAKQLAQRQATLDKLAKLPAPKPQHIAKVGGNIAPETKTQISPPKQALPGAPLAAGDGVVEKNTSISSGICTPDCGVTYVQESSVAGNGKYLFQTGNWYATYSTNGGTSWNALDPYSLDANFCCDQHVIYEPARNVFIWEMMIIDNGGGTNGLDLVTYNGDLSGGCIYHFNSTTFGMAANQELDFPDIQFTANDTYLTWNTYSPTGSSWENSGLMRMPTDAIATCAGFSYQYTLRSDIFTFILVSGSTEAINFASQWCTSACTTGSQMEFYNWAESAGSYGILTLNINPYPFNGGGQNCASSDNVVTNWCGFSDSRRGAGYVSRAGYRGFGGQVIGFAWSAGANAGGGFPYPYVVRNYFVLPTMTYKGSDVNFNTTFGIQYPGCADTPYLGYVSCTLVYGGGTGGTHIYPSELGFVEDKTYPTQAWFDYGLCSGTANAPTDRWGDYTTTAAWSDGQHWVEGDWCMSGAAAVSSNFAIVGLQANHNSYLTWIGR